MRMDAHYYQVAAAKAGASALESMLMQAAATELSEPLQRLMAPLGHTGEACSIIHDGKVIAEGVHGLRTHRPISGVRGPMVCIQHRRLQSFAGTCCNHICGVSRVRVRLCMLAASMSMPHLVLFLTQNL